MPRVARITAPDCLYHIICRGNNQQTVFYDDDDYKQYLWFLGKYKAQHPFHLYHYVLMSNHIHMLIEPSSSEALARGMLKLNLTYTQYFQKKYGGTGHLWQGRYKSILVSRDSYCLACAAYIELNPLTAGIIQSPEEYTWSSYRFYAFGITNTFITQNPLYEGLGQTVQDRQATYRELVRNSLRQKTLTEEAVDRLRYFGSADFITQMEAMTGLPNHGQRGRPKNRDVSIFDKQKYKRPYFYDS